MKSTKSLLSIVIIALLVSGCLFCLVQQAKADVPPESLAVTLNGPANNTVYIPTVPSSSYNFTVDFTYTPILYGTDNFNYSSLIINGTSVATNQTAIVNQTINQISYNLTSNGVYLWNIKVYNSTSVVNATDLFVVTMNAHVVEVTPTPTEAPTPTPTPIVTATPTPTPSPTPKPTTPTVNALTIAVIIVVLAVIIGVAAYLLLRRSK
jgi:hypothetical protein